MHDNTTRFKNKLAAATAARQANKKLKAQTYGIKKVMLDDGKSRWVLSLAADAETIRA